MSEFIASILVAAIRYHHHTKDTFLCDAFGDDVDIIEKELSFLATGDESECARYWEKLFHAHYGFN